MGSRNKYYTYGKPEDAPEDKAMTIDEVIDDIGFGWAQIKLGLVIVLVWAADGMEIMVVAILGPTLEYQWNISPAQQAALSMLVFVGFLIGSPIFGYISDKYGRWTSLVCSSIWTFFYGVLNAAAPNFIWMVILRMLLGFGIAGGMQAITFYTEFIPSRNRGKIALLFTVYWSIGGLLNVAVAMWVIQYSWRYWLVLSVVPSLVFLLCSPFIPESPRFELACGRKKEALKILQSIARGNGCTLPNINIIEADIKSRGQISDLFIPAIRKTSILVGISFFCYGFLYYGTALFSTYLMQAGSTCSSFAVGKESFHCGLLSHPIKRSTFIKLLWTTSAEFPGMLVTIVIIDPLGRKKTGVLFCSIIGFCILALYICMDIIPMVILLFVARGLGAALVNILYLYSSEVFPTELRATATGFGSGMARLGGIMTPLFSQVLFSFSKEMGLAAYVMIAFLNTLAYYLLPIETKGREMGNILE